MSQSQRPSGEASNEGLSVRAILRVIVVVLVTAGVLWLLYALRSVILLLVLAVFFAYMVAPLVRLVRRPFRVSGRRVAIPPGVAILVVYVLLFVAVAVVARLVGPALSLQLTQFSQQGPQYMSRLNDELKRLGEIASNYDLPTEAQGAIDNAVSNALQSATAAVQGLGVWLLGLLTYVPWLVLVPILGFFLLQDGDAMRRRAIMMMPTGPLRQSTSRILWGVDRTIASYVRAQFVACLFVGLVCTIAFEIVGVPYALVLGTLAGLFEFVPLVGPLALGVIVAVVAAFSSVHMAVVVLVFLIVLRVFEDYIIYPRIIGHGSHLHPLAVILAVLCGAEIGGIAGVFLAVPVAGILTVLLTEVGGPEEVLAELLEPPAELEPVESGDAT